MAYSHKLKKRQSSLEPSGLHGSVRHLHDDFAATALIKQMSLLAILVGVRAYKRLDMDPSPAAYTGRAVGSRAGSSAFQKSYPCDSDSLYCIDEEWTWY